MVARSKDNLTRSKVSATATESPCSRLVRQTRQRSMRLGPTERSGRESCRLPAISSAKAGSPIFDFPTEFKEADFFDFKKLNLAVDWSGKYPTPSPTLQHLIRCCEYWIAYADVDGFRIDAVKHMGQESTRIFCAAIHEFTQSLGKERFFLAGEVTGGRGHGAWSMVDTTGLDAALGIEDIPGRLQSMVKGFTEPNKYFALFRNSELADHGDFAWFGQHVVTMFDDHDQIQKGNEKRRFCGTVEYRKLIFNALAVNLTTAGISLHLLWHRAAFDSGSQPSPSDKVLRENMFGGALWWKMPKGCSLLR